MIPVPTLPERLTHSNATFIAGRRLVTPESISCLSHDGCEIEGWLYRPPSSAAAPAPLVLIIHGGPHAAYGESFMLRAQILAGRGYAALYANPRGSTGYGEAFMQACDHDWGGGDYRDLMSILDAALALGDLDPSRLAVTGASYGGYMTNWIIGQTRRFAGSRHRSQRHQSSTPASALEISTRSRRRETTAGPGSRRASTASGRPSPMPSMYAHQYGSSLPSATIAAQSPRARSTIPGSRNARARRSSWYAFLMPAIRLTQVRASASVISNSSSSGSSAGYRWSRRHKDGWSGEALHLLWWYV